MKKAQAKVVKCTKKNLGSLGTPLGPLSVKVHGQCLFLFLFLFGFLFLFLFCFRFCFFFVFVFDFVFVFVLIEVTALCEKFSLQKARFQISI